MARFLVLLSAILAGSCLPAQQYPLYGSLPVGKYPVGFKILTITDDSRVSVPEYNYLGEKNEGDRSKKISIHLWYPALAGSGNRDLRFEDYCYNNLLAETNGPVPDQEKNGQVNRRRTAIEGWFGKTTDEAWKKLLVSPMLARADASPVKEKFPLLIGMLRPLSTCMVNEVLASNGYVVAMVKSGSTGSTPQAAIMDIPDMQFTLSHLFKTGMVDIQNTGAFSFSGAGFTPFLLAMFDQRVKAVADIESGLYMEGLFQGLSASNYYDPGKLRIPFLHIFSLDLSREEKFFHEFETKTKFSRRYRLLLNQPKLHHWDVATEGYVSCIALQNRGTDQVNIRQSFEISALYLLRFFNAELKADPGAKIFFAAKPVLPSYQPALWDITMLGAIKPAPNRDELEYIIRKKGITEALNIVRNTIKEDSSTNITQGFVLNSLGYSFLYETKFEEAIGVFKLNTELHPAEANFFDSLAEGYEVSGDKAGMKKTSDRVMAILGKKTTLTEAEKSLRETAERRIKM